MVGIFIVILIVVVVAYLYLYSSSGISGGGEYSEKAKICGRAHAKVREITSRFKGSIDDFDQFNEVVPEENAEIFTDMQLVEYSEYFKLCKGTGIEEYFKMLIDLPEIYFKKEDSIYDPSSVAITYSPQTTRYNYNIKQEHNPNFTEITFNRRVISQQNSLTHMGKVKLFIADLQAIMYLLPSDATRLPQNGGAEKYRILYVGSAPGHQTVFLADIFKNVKFILYDKNPYDSRLYKMKNVVIYADYFTDKQVIQYYKTIDIFISDLRLIVHSQADLAERQIHEDMLMQQTWIIGMKPRIGSMVKFRPPYSIRTFQDETYIPASTEYKYLGGTVYWQVFPWKQSTEGRLLSTAADIEAGPVLFDYKKYEAGCLQHSFRRIWCTYRPGIPRDPSKEPGPNNFISMPELIKFPGFDRCLDCQYLLSVCAEFINKYRNHEYSANSVKNFMHKITEATNPLICQCDGSPMKIRFEAPIHGFYQNETRFQKHKRFIDIWNALYNDESS